MVFSKYLEREKKKKEQLELLSNKYINIKFRESFICSFIDSVLFPIGWDKDISEADSKNVEYLGDVLYLAIEKKNKDIILSTLQNILDILCYYSSSTNKLQLINRLINYNEDVCYLFYNDKGIDRDGKKNLDIVGTASNLMSKYLIKNYVKLFEDKEEYE